MESEPVFEYESDWVEYFNSVLKNEIREDIDNRNHIKANIIESNQSFESFLKRNPSIICHASKEPGFHNLNVIQGDTKYYFYLNTVNPRFWVIHNIERKTEIQEFIEKVTCDNYLQDHIYLSQRMFENYQESMKSNCSGFILNFDQKFSEAEAGVFRTRLDDFDDVNFTMQLWPKRAKSIKFFIEKLKAIKCPINYRLLNFVFEDDANDVLVKEDLQQDGSFSINRGRDLRKHLAFVDEIKTGYHDKMEQIESYRINWELMEGSRYSILFDREINPKNFIGVINQNASVFKLNAFFMYDEGDSALYNCIDLHTGDHFYVQVFPDRMNIMLHDTACGNIIFRLFSNLQRFFLVSTSLEVDGSKFSI
jgi:hypothetical protein